MKYTFKSSFLMGLISLILASIACSVTAPPSPTQTPPLPTKSPTPPATNTSPPTVEPSPVVEDAITDSDIECTVLQDVNLRNGPGLAYRNPIGIVEKDTVVVPVGFNPVGIPGGSWMLIEAEGENPSGWITAGASFVSCNSDLAELPPVEVAEPPPPLPPSSAQSSDAEGGCGPSLDYQCEVIVTDASFIQFKIFRKGKELTENNDVTKVSFSVRQGGNEVYSTVENSSAYCIFGGNGPCNHWPFENDIYSWPNGAPVSAGTYFVEIFATVNENGSTNDVRWAADFSVKLP